MNEAVRCAEMESCGDGPKYDHPKFSLFHRYVRIGRHDDLLKTPTHKLPNSFEAIYQLSGVDDPDRFAEITKAVNCNSEVAEVEALITGQPRVQRPPLRLYYETPLKPNEKGWAGPRSSIHFFGSLINQVWRNQKKEWPIEYDAIFWQGVFYLVRNDDAGIPVLYRLRDRQAHSMLLRLRGHTTYPFAWIATSAFPRIVYTMKKRKEDRERWAWELVAKGARVDFSPQYEDVPLVDGRTFRRLAVPRQEPSIMGSLTAYKRSPRRFLDGGEIYDVLDGPLPDKITRYAEKWKYIPKEIVPSDNSLATQYAKEQREREWQEHKRQQEQVALETKIRSQVTELAVKMHVEEFMQNMPADVKAAIEERVRIELEKRAKP